MTKQRKDIDRRRFLQGLGTLVAASGLGINRVFGANSRQPVIEPLKVPDWSRQQGRPAGSLRYGQPSGYESRVQRILTSPVLYDQIPPQPSSSWTYTPLQDLHGSITPNGLFYERHHAGIPNIDPREHRLIVHGLVGQAKMFTMADIKRFPAVTRTHFIECSGNTDTEWEKPTGRTVQETHGLLSCAQWTGVPLNILLKECGIKGSAGWVLAEGADAANMLRSVPIQMALDDVLLVYAQNGEALRPEQGYPLRFLVPGGEGNMNVKWLRRLEISDQPAQSREETSKYTDLMTNGLARQFTFVMQANSVITQPSGSQNLGGHGFYEIRGLAWSGNGKISHVDVSVDGGRNWQPAQLQTPVENKALTVFRFPWEWRGQGHVLFSRATDETGYVQPTRTELVKVRGSHSEYHNNGLQPWEVRIDGSVINSYG